MRQTKLVMLVLMRGVSVDPFCCHGKSWIAGALIHGEFSGRTSESFVLSPLNSAKEIRVLLLFQALRMIAAHTKIRTGKTEMIHRARRVAIFRVAKRLAYLLWGPAGGSGPSWCSEVWPLLWESLAAVDIKDRYPGLLLAHANRDDTQASVIVADWSSMS